MLHMGTIKIQFIKQFGTLKPNVNFRKLELIGGLSDQHRQLLCWTDAVFASLGLRSSGLFRRLDASRAAPCHTTRSKPVWVQGRARSGYKKVSSLWKWANFYNFITFSKLNIWLNYEDRRPEFSQNGGYAVGFAEWLRAIDLPLHQVEAQPDCGPGSEIGTGWKVGVTWSRKRSFKMAAAELGYLLTKSSFWPSLWQLICRFAKNYKFDMFCQQCHPSVASGDANIRSRNASRIHTRHLFTS